MKIGLTILMFMFCSLTNTNASMGLTYLFDFGTTNQKDSIIRVLVLPPYDAIANAGISPDTRKILESILEDRDSLEVIPISAKKLGNVPIHMVYDKKYCKEIVDKIDCDIVVMTQIITKNELEPGIWPWSYKIRIYNVGTDKQLESINGTNLKAEDFETDFRSKKDQLIKDILKTFE